MDDGCKLESSLANRPHPNIIETLFNLNVGELSDDREFVHKFNPKFFR